MKTSLSFVLSLVVCIRAFAPPQSAVLNARRMDRHSSLAILEMQSDKTSKRKIALKTVGKVACAAGAIAVGITASAGASTAVVGTAAGSRARYVVGSLAVAATAGFMARITITAGQDAQATGGTADKINKFFPGAITNKSLVKKVLEALKQYDYGSNSLVATSLSPDEVNRCLETEFSEVFGNTFTMGGLAGVPFGGSTSFGNMASHIPQGESTLIVFAPHVGVDGEGNIGTVERRGRSYGGACCDSAIAASNYVLSVHNGKTTTKGTPNDALDAQQNFVESMLLPQRLDASPDAMVELPYALYDAQKEMITDIVSTAAGAVSGVGKIAMLGGIQINTPPGIHDYYLPLSLEVYDNTGQKLDDLKL